MSEETLLEVEKDSNRETIAASLRSLADQLDEGGEVDLSGEGGTVTLSPPDQLSHELEVEREDDEFEIEIELGWSDDDGDVEVDASKADFELYEDSAGEYRWRLVHDNGNTIADSGEGYSSRASAENGIQSVKENAPGAEIERVD